MEGLFASGTIVDLILLLMAIEGALIVVYRRVTGAGVPVRDLAAMLAAGACLMLALRAALVGAAWPWIALALVAALATHLIDLARRWG